MWTLRLWGLRSHPPGSSAPENITTTLQLYGLTNLFAPPCQSDQSASQPTPLAMAGPLFPYYWNPYYLLLDSQTSFICSRLDQRLHIKCLELKVVSFALRHWATVLQGLPLMIAEDSTTVVSYINKQGDTQSFSILRLVVATVTGHSSLNQTYSWLIADRLSWPN